MRTPPDLAFLPTDYNANLNDLITQFEALTGRVLSPAQVERILIDLIAYEGQNQRIAMKDAILQAFPQFARGAMLDLHAEANGLERLSAQPARTLIAFTLNAPKAADTVIGAGQQIGTQDNAYIFTTTENITIPAGALTGEARAFANQPGADGSGYLVGQVANLFAPIPGVISAVNSSVTSSGADAEQDEELLIRILLAIATASTAGPKNSYIALARGAHSNIVDVAVLGPTEHGQLGVVQIFTLTRSGAASAEIKDLVLAVVSADRLRPITDFVQVLDPVNVAFNVTVELTVLNSANVEGVQEAAFDAVRALTNAWAIKLGTDIRPSNIIAAVDKIAGVHSVDVPGLAFTPVAENQYPALGTLTVNVVGVTDG